MLPSECLFISNFFFHGISHVVVRKTDDNKAGPSKHVSICIMLPLTVADEQEEEK